MRGNVNLVAKFNVKTKIKTIKGLQYKTIKTF